MFNDTKSEFILPLKRFIFLSIFYGPISLFSIALLLFILPNSIFYILVKASFIFFGFFGVLSIFGNFTIFFNKSIYGLYFSDVMKFLITPSENFVFFNKDTLDFAISSLTHGCLKHSNTNIINVKDISNLVHLEGLILFPVLFLLKGIVLEPFLFIGVRIGLKFVKNYVDKKNRESKTISEFLKTYSYLLIFKNADDAIMAKLMFMDGSNGR